MSTSAVKVAPAPPDHASRAGRGGLWHPAGDRAVIAGPTALAAVLCLVGLTTRSLSFDEAATVTIAAQHGSALGAAIGHDGGNMSGFYVLLHVLMNWFGDGELVLRLPSALASIATVALIGMIGLRLFGRRAALAAGLLAAVSLPLVFWAQNARGYAVMVALVTAAYLVFVSLDRDPRLRGWVAYVVLMSLATYASFVAVLVIPAQLLALLSSRRRRRLAPFALAVMAIAVLCLPLIVLASQRGSGQLFWLPRPKHEIEVQVLQSLTSAGLGPSFHTTATTTLLLVTTLAGLIAVTVAYWPRRGGSRDGGAVGLVLAWVLVPPLLTFAYSLLFQPLFLPRNLLVSVPAVALMLGAGLGHPRLPGRVALGVLLVLIGLRALALAPTYGVSPEPWRQASSFVLARAQAGDCLAFYPADGRMAFEYFYGRRPSPHQPLPPSILPTVPWGVVRPYVEDYATLSPAQLGVRRTRCRRLWLVSSHEGQPDGPPRARANRTRFIALQSRLVSVFGPGQTARLGYASAIHVQLLARGARRG